MPAREQFDAREFAAFVASFTNNPSEAEALIGARMIYREAKRNGGGRIVDLFYRADVMAALDANLEPVREESPEVKGLENKVTELADALAREKEITEELRGEVDDLLATNHEAVANQIIIPPRASSDGLVNGGLVAAVSIVAVVLMIAAAFQWFQ